MLTILITVFCQTLLTKSVISPNRFYINTVVTIYLHSSSGFGSALQLYINVVVITYLLLSLGFGVPHACCKYLTTFVLEIWQASHKE